MLRKGKTGRIPASVSRILERLGVSNDGWLAVVKNFGRLFRRAAGSPTSLAEEATRCNRAWLHGARNSRELFAPGSGA